MNDLEISILVYFASCALRECLQMLVAASLGEYFQDPRNLMDIGSVLAFMSGLYHKTESAAAGHQDAATSISAWKLYYGFSLFLLVLRSLRVLSTFDKLGVLVLVMFKMIQDVSNFLVVFFIFTLNFAVLLFDAGTAKPYLDRDSCGDGEAGYASCIQIQWFLQTLLQGFGELFLDEVEHGASFYLALIAFTALNIMLLNLLIAVTSCLPRSKRPTAERQEQVYGMWRFEHLPAQSHQEHV